MLPTGGDEPSNPWPRGAGDPSGVPGDICTGCPVTGHKGGDADNVLQL